ncbi:DUF1294 domain-containing protein [Tenuibacillus multivorans]|uniref:Uncharacterized membrane protein YsdA, DUF1294 family n=1 Tax=Tenuibacillus multivorans TaxID=237069 RepID=A0A1G9ZRS7_9BACI|nr:DUF1294 domain-containing protein [Tenuibacillus multivorans]GEL76824.1 hypothetical protein TMU01_10590 [Tenuibacillus multivorans]SDN23900.1 Uncharacterized membrane protein YsdA, DUF1294 family [Tenuibacillus multivorans]
MALLYGILMMSFIGFILMGIDKRKARKEQWRIPEKTLWLWAIIGGAPGMWPGMKAFHHKTKHKTFKFGLPILTIMWLLLLIYLS